MRITLYKGCKLNNRYVEVYHHTALENYLNTLTKTTFELETVYQTNSGTINLELDYSNNFSIYEYNYMKVETKDSENDYNFVRYCFIDDIIIRNEIATLYYSEDIFSSYSSSINMTNSYLSRSRKLLYKISQTQTKQIGMYNVPVKYNGVNPLIYTNISGTTTDFAIFAQLQYYDAEKYGESTERTVKVVRIYNGKLENGTWNYYRYFTLENARKCIEELVKTQSKKVFRLPSVDDPSGDIYYQIDNFTILPSTFLGTFDSGNRVFPNYTRSTLGSNFVGRIYFVDSQTIIRETAFFEIPENLKAEFQNKFVSSASFLVPNNLRNIGIGTITSQYNIEDNGLARRVEIWINIGEYNFDVYLAYDNQTIKITDDFVLDIPFDSLLGEEQAQRKLTRQLKTVNGVSQIVGGTVKVAGEIATGFSGASATAVSQLTATGKIARNKIANIRRNSQYVSGGVNTVEGTLGGINEIVGGISTLMEANQPNYTSNQGTFSTSDAFMSANNGIMVSRINSSNDSYVQGFIDNTGYVVYEMNFNALDYEPVFATSETNKYNVIKYDFVNIYGDFPQNIMEILTSILLNGVIIHYN